MTKKLWNLKNDIYNWSGTTPTQHLQKIPKCYFPILQISMTFLMVLVGIRIEEKLAKEEAHQPHSQMYFSYVSTDGSMEGWWALFAALNLTSVHPSDAPSWMQRGCIWAGISSSEDGGRAREADSSAWSIGAEASCSVDTWGKGKRWEG